MNDRIVPAPFDAAPRALRLPPVGALHVGPPLVMVVEWHRLWWWSEHHGARDEILGRCAWEVFGPGRSFGNGHVASRLHELNKLVVRHFGAVHPEAVDIDP